MAHILITGSSDGLGLMTGRLLTGQGHTVTLHARNDERATHARTVPAPRSTELESSAMSREILIAGGHVVTLDDSLGDLPGGDVRVLPGRPRATPPTR